MCSASCASGFPFCLWRNERSSVGECITHHRSHMLMITQTLRCINSRGCQRSIPHCVGPLGQKCQVTANQPTNRQPNIALLHLSAQNPFILGFQYLPYPSSFKSQVLFQGFVSFPPLSPIPHPKDKPQLMMN